MYNNIKFHCRVCGHYLGYNPYGDDDNSPDYDFCSCCGVEFGHQDYTPESTKKFRIRWISQKFYWRLGERKTFYDKELQMWSNEELKPKNWNPLEQLKNIGVDFSKKEIVEEYKIHIPDLENILQPYLKNEI